MCNHLLQHFRYGIKLSVPSAEGMSDLWLRCESESQYTQWMAACRFINKSSSSSSSSLSSSPSCNEYLALVLIFVRRLAAKGKSLADFGFEQEVNKKCIKIIISSYITILVLCHPCHHDDGDDNKGERDQGVLINAAPCSYTGHQPKHS